jgi:WD40 repeat protein
MPDCGEGAWAQDGKRLALAGKWGIEIWDIEPKRKVITFSEKHGAKRLAWSPDATRMAAVHGDGMLRVWNVGDAMLLHESEVGRWKELDGGGKENRLFWSAQAKRLVLCVSGGENSYQWTWDDATWKCDPVARTVERGGRPVMPLDWKKPLEEILLRGSDNDAWHPAAEQFLTLYGEEGPQVKGLDGAIQRRFRAVHPSANYAVFDPTGTYVATAGRDTVRLWDFASGEPLATLVWLGNGTRVAVSASGHFKADGPLEDELVVVAQTAEGQLTLTPAEFEQKFGWKNDPQQVRLRAVGQGSDVR